ncbi:MAG: beta-lactamase family protein [Lewinellaceae bacterium]|nr:beta-lactamase family protein [Lewinellaceae bacterium]
MFVTSAVPGRESGRILGARQLLTGSAGGNVHAMPISKSAMKYFMPGMLTAFLSITCAGQEAGRILQEEQITPKIDSLVRQYQDLDIFSGVVLVAEKGVPVYHKAFGLANRRTGKMNTLHTKFDIGSMNKSMTKVVVLQLVHEGKLHLGDHLGDHLDGFAAEAADHVTIEHLLEHRSGFGDYHDPDFFELPKSEKNIAALLKRIRKMPLLFEPGTDQQYSNTGYVLLGAIIEKVTGRSFYQNVRERIVEPLGMKETYLVDKYAVPDRATGYFKTAKGELEDNEGFLEVPNPDGGFQSTASDMLVFYRAFHYGDRLWGDETRQLDELYPFYKQTATTGSGAVAHAGGFEGANTVHYEVLRDQISIIVFANMDEPVAEQLGLGVLTIIRGKEPSKPALPAVQNVYKACEEKGLAYVKDHFEPLTVNFHPTDPKDIILNAVGYTYLRDGEVEKAIGVFTLNTEWFPDVANVWDSLGEALLAKGDREAAPRIL